LRQARPRGSARCHGYRYLTTRLDCLTISALKLGYIGSGMIESGTQCSSLKKGGPGCEITPTKSDIRALRANGQWQSLWNSSPLLITPGNCKAIVIWKQERICSKRAALSKEPPAQWLNRAALFAIIALILATVSGRVPPKRPSPKIRSNDLFFTTASQEWSTTSSAIRVANKTQRSIDPSVDASTLRIGEKVCRDKSRSG